MARIKIGRKILLFSILVLVLGPFVWIFMTSLKDFKDIMLGRIINFMPNLRNYVDLFAEQGSDYPQFLLNSVIVSLASTFITVAIGALAAYDLVKFRLIGNLNRYILGWLLFIRMIFPIALAIPLFDLMRGYNLLNTRLSLILAYIVINLPYSVWILRVFFAGIPRDIQDAAKVDGCSEFGVFIRIALPLVGPGLGAASTFIFIYSWNEFLFALIFTSSPKAMTLPVGIARLCQQYFIQWGKISAAASIFIIPVFILSLVTQKHLIRGLTFQVK